MPEMVSFIAFVWWVQPGGPSNPNRAALVCFSAFIGLIVHYIVRKGWKKPLKVYL
jgi:hypothetical protein